MATAQDSSNEAGSQQCRNANWLLTKEAYRKVHLSVSNATAMKIQKNLVVWKTIYANFEGTNLMSVWLLGFASHDATAAPLFLHFFFNLRRDRYNALQKVSGLGNKDHDLQDWLRE